MIYALTIMCLECRCGMLFGKIDVFFFIASVECNIVKRKKLNIEGEF